MSPLGLCGFWSFFSSFSEITRELKLEEDVGAETLSVGDGARGFKGLASCVCVQYSWSLAVALPAESLPAGCAGWAPRSVTFSAAGSGSGWKTSSLGRVVHCRSDRLPTGLQNIWSGLYPTDKTGRWRFVRQHDMPSPGFGGAPALAGQRAAAAFGQTLLAFLLDVNDLGAS